MAIKQTVNFECEPDHLFELLTDAGHFSKITGMPARIDSAASGEFSLFDGMITGQTTKAETGKLLVQKWRAGNWDDGVFSTVTFELNATGDGSTRLQFEHSGYPVEHEAHLAQGWHDRYWNPITEYLKG